MEIPTDARPVDASFPPDVIEAFVAATVTAFEELTGSVIVAQAPFVLARPVSLDVSATVVLRHDPPGHLLLAFPLPVLNALAARYLGDAELLTSELVDDAAGEFANVIAGQAKTMLKGKPSHYLLTTPIVTHARGLAPASAHCNLLTWFFDCDMGTFALQVDLR